MDLDEIVPTSDCEEEELNECDLLNLSSNLTNGLDAPHNHRLTGTPNTPSKRREFNDESPRKRRRLSSSHQFAALTTRPIPEELDENVLERSGTPCNYQNTTHPPPIVEAVTKSFGHSGDSTVLDNEVQENTRPPNMIRSHVSTQLFDETASIFEDVSNHVQSPRTSGVALSLRSLSSPDLDHIPSLPGSQPSLPSAPPSLEAPALRISSPPDVHLVTPDPKNDRRNPTAAISARDNNLQHDFIPDYDQEASVPLFPRSPMPKTPERQMNILSPSSSPDPLALFTQQMSPLPHRFSTPELSPMHSSGHIVVASSPLTPAVSPVQGRPSSSSSSLNRSSSPQPEAGPSNPRSTAPPKPPHEQSPELQTGSPQPVRQLRPRKAPQLKPYTADLLRYKLQIRGIPDAYEPMPELRRRRRSPNPESDRELTSDPDVRPMDLDDEELSEGERRRARRRASRSSSGPVHLPAERQRQRQKTAERLLDHDRGEGPSRRPAEREVTPAQAAPLWYPEAFNLSSSSSDEDDDIVALLRPLAKPKSTEPAAKLKRPKRFPMRKPPIHETLIRPQKDPTPPPSVVAVSHRGRSVARVMSPASQLNFGDSPKSSAVRHSPIQKDSHDMQDRNFIDFRPENDVIIPSEFDFPPSSSHVSSVDQGLDDTTFPLDDNPKIRATSIIELIDSSDHAHGQSSEEEDEGGSSSSSDHELSKKERKRLKILKRMMPPRLIQKYIKGTDRPRRDSAERSASPSRDYSDDDSDRPLLPGQSRIRRAANPPSMHHIRGDSESSDIEIPDGDIRRSLSGSPSPSPLPSQDSGSESDVGDYVGRARHTINLLSSESEHDDVESVNTFDEPRGEEWVSGSSRQQNVYSGEAREGDLIDRMLSRSRVSGPKKAKRPRTKKRSTGQPKLSRNAVDLVVGGSKRYGKGHQTRLPFARQPSSKKSIRLERHAAAADTEILEISDDERGDAFQHHVDPQTVTDVLKRKALKNTRIVKNAAGVFVLPSNAKHLTSGRSHQPYTIDTEMEAISRTTVAFPNRGDRHPSSSRKRRPKPPATGSELPLDLIWQRIVDPKASSPAPQEHRGKDQHRPNEDVLHHVEIDCGVQVLPSGLVFGGKTYLGKGRLQELFTGPTVSQDEARPMPCIVFDFHITSFASAHDFQDAIEGLVSKLVKTISDPSKSISSEDYHEWQKAFLTATQHITWFLTHSDAEDIASLRLEIDEDLRRISTVVEEHYAVRSDLSLLNLLVFEAQWFDLELAWRCRGLGDTASGDDPTSALHHVKALVKHLFAFGLDRPMKAISTLGVDDSNDVYRIAELWIAVMNLIGHWNSPASAPHAIPSFWHIVLESARAMDFHRFASYNIAISELLWRTIFQLCSLSQFSVHGMSTSTPKLPASWPFVTFALEQIRLEAHTEPDKQLTRRSLRKGDSYIRLLVSRCMLLNKRWHWKLDDASVLFNRLSTIFKSRRFANLTDEKSDFPSFLRQNKLEFLSEHRNSDSAFTLFLKLVVQAAVQANPEVQEPQQRRLPMTVKKILQLAVPVGSVPFTKTSPPTEGELAMLYNRFSAIAIAIYLEPTVSNTKYRLALARRYVNFGNADRETRRACIRAFMQLCILLRHLSLPLNDILDWLAEMTNSLIQEYRDFGHPPVAGTNGSSWNPSRESTIICVGLILGAVRKIIEIPAMESGVESTPYPDPALLDGPWISRIFSIETDLTSVSKIRTEVRRLVHEFLRARAAVIPKPVRSRKPSVVLEESQESQDDYGQFDIDLNDPELLAALGESNSSSLSDDLLGKEQRVSELIDLHISPAIYRLVCTHFNEQENLKTSRADSNDTDSWIDCWVGCASVLVQTGKRDWSLYFNLGPQSWERISDASWRRRVGLRFMFKVLELDPTAYTDHQDRFLEVFMESLVTPRVTIEHQYAALLFTIDDLHHPFLQGLHIGDRDFLHGYSLTTEEFIEYRLSWIEQIFSRLADGLRIDARDMARKTMDQLWLGFIIRMLVAMRDTLEAFPVDSKDRKEYAQLSEQIGFVRFHLQNIQVKNRLS
ncbi:unnamed protein product [Somion occarium]|uniref:Mus7/MMS22 family-domain-containing protein n=1 Tax=Somion occarium TaxID=3059160 RepID=A0ABP1DYQ7_9APHY